MYATQGIPLLPKLSTVVILPANLLFNN